jgi:hypothetical protein
MAYPVLKRYFSDNGFVSQRFSTALRSAHAWKMEWWALLTR